MNNDNTRAIKRFLNVAIILQVVYFILLNLLYVFQKPLLWGFFVNREVENLNPIINPAYIVVDFVVMLCFVVICSAAKDSIDKSFASSVGVFSGV